ncbi:hypothetical protein [Amycolatopsis sp. NPDC003731]
MTFIRFLDGAGGQQFFEKNVPNSAPTGCPRCECAAPEVAPAAATARSSMPCPTNSPRWCGRPTWPPRTSRPPVAGRRRRPPAVAGSAQVELTH